MRNPFCKTFTSQDFTKRIFFAYFFFGYHLELFSVPSSVYTTKNVYQGFFNYSEVKRDEQTQATDLSLKNNRDVL